MPLTKKNRKIFVGNWKMHKTIVEAQQYVAQLISLVKGTPDAVWLAVPFTALNSVARAAEGSCLTIGTQNISEHVQGAYTGEVSAIMANDAGAHFTIIGHSERRQCFHEVDAAINGKIRRALDARMKPLLCIGETLEQRRNGATQSVLIAQINAALANVNAHEIAEVVIAYEPIWAIGSGQAASLELVADVHCFCRAEINRLFGRAAAVNMPILYGGSVNAGNASELLNCHDINGVLVGSASLQPHAFSGIINYQNLQSQSICHCP